MKKYLLSAAFISLLGLAAQAQDNKSQQGSRNSSADQENNKATLAPADQKAETVEQQQPQAGSQQNDATKQKGATRMAITEKGVPASKNKDAAPDQKATEQKKSEAAKSPKN
ncbi:MAG: hypothetical protein JNL60_12055 [Bacteroidia bacterium]|nr:hypothetical protein [Bacteroidia bacterium]